jgi:hypothetical protein
LVHSREIGGMNELDEWNFRSKAQRGVAGVGFCPLF